MAENLDKKIKISIYYKARQPIFSKKRLSRSRALPTLFPQEA
jgi:hypothetical protein